MQRRTLTVLIFILIVFSFSISLAAEQRPQDKHDTYFDKVTYKIGRGATNLFLSPLEIPRGIDHGIKEHGYAGGIAIGVVKGLGKGVGRMAVGFWDFLSSPFATKSYKSYWMEPEFITDIDNWDKERPELSKGENKLEEEPF